MKIYLSIKRREAGCGLTAAEVAGLALSVAGAGASEVARTKEKDAMNHTVSNQLRQQQEYQKKGQGILNERVQGASPLNAKQQMDQGTSEAMSEYGKLNQIPVTASSAASPSASSATTGGETQARVNLFNQAAAPIMGMEDWQTKQAIDDLKTRTMLGQNNQFSQQTASLLPYQLQAASQSQSGLDSVGSLLGTVGGLVGEWGATQPAASAASTAGAAGGAANAGFGGFEGAMPGTTMPAWLKRMSAPSLIPNTTV